MLCHNKFYYHIGGGWLWVLGDHTMLQFLLVGLQFRLMFWYCDDNVLEENEEFILTILAESLPNDIRLGNPNKSTVTIVDDDSKWLAVVPTYVCT